jgi:hypothetical protein
MSLCHSHKICYIRIWHVLFVSRCIYIYRDARIPEMDSATGSIYFGDSGVDRHHVIISNTLNLSQLWVLCTLVELLQIQAICVDPYAIFRRVHRSTQFVWFIMGGYPFISVHPLPTLFLLTLIFHRKSHFGCHARCNGVSMMGCLPSSFSLSPHCDRVNLEMLSEALIKRVWWP